jgi:hypothetical protein
MTWDTLVRRHGVDDTPRVVTSQITGFSIVRFDLLIGILILLIGILILNGLICWP